MIKQNIFKLIASGVLCGFSLISGAQELSSVSSPAGTNSTAGSAPVLSSISRPAPDSTSTPVAPAVQQLSNSTIQESRPAEPKQKSHPQNSKDSLLNTSIQKQ
jgi:hypothetical protein